MEILNADARTTTLLELDSTLKDQAIGASRFGKNTKVHVLINDRMQLLNVILTGGNIHDSQPVIELFANVDLNDKKILADKAYSCQVIHDYLYQYLVTSLLALTN